MNRMSIERYENFVSALATVKECKRDVRYDIAANVLFHSHGTDNTTAFNTGWKAYRDEMKLHSPVKSDKSKEANEARTAYNSGYQAWKRLADSCTAHTFDGAEIVPAIDVSDCLEYFDGEMDIEFSVDNLFDAIDSAKKRAKRIAERMQQDVDQKNASAAAEVARIEREHLRAELIAEMKLAG